MGLGAVSASVAALSVAPSKGEPGGALRDGADFLRVASMREKPYKRAIGA